MTISELRERQAWTLEQKIDHAVGTIEAFIAKTGKTPYISFSGGKDSTVLLDICRRFVDKDMKAVFCNTGNEYPEIVNFVKTFDNVTIIRPETSIKKVIENYGFPLISKVQAQAIRQIKTTKSEKLRNIRLYGAAPEKGFKDGKLSDKWKFLLKEQFNISEQCCDLLKKKPFKKYEKETGEIPILGVMADNGKKREDVYIMRGGCNSFINKSSWPLAIWTDKDIWAYIKKLSIPYCELYDKGHTRTGCMVCGFGVHLEKQNRFEPLYDYHKNIYLALLKLENNGITYREALRKVGVWLPDEIRQLKLF